MSSFGRLYRVTTAGESHGGGMTVIVDGCPPGIPLTAVRDIDPALARRRPGQSRITTSRNESDVSEILSGMEGGTTLGTPICVLVRNADQRPKDYSFQKSDTANAGKDEAAVEGGARESGPQRSDRLNVVPRPSHADYTYHHKYDGYVASSGGGRASARETVSRVVAGAIAEAVLAVLLPAYRCVAYASQIGPHSVPHDQRPPQLSPPTSSLSPAKRNVTVGATTATTDGKEISSSPTGAAATAAATTGRSFVDTFITRLPNEALNTAVEELLLQLKQEGDSIGGVVSCTVQGLPPGLGEPCFDKLPALLAHAMMSIPATKGFEFGSGFDCARQRGTEHNDIFLPGSDCADGGACDGGSDVKGRQRLRTATNNSGGSQGGISNGEDIAFRVAFKPPATIGKTQTTASLGGVMTELSAAGRHDPCVVPRAVPIVEAMAALVVLDLLLIQASRRAISASSTLVADDLW